ncbi:MAG: carboxy terminal-processing peptidase [Puniceicoccales bacterium]|nr:carboxy terminal-processing peptidase [Puniceicoccales bacterium]
MHYYRTFLTALLPVLALNGLLFAADTAPAPADKAADTSVKARAEAKVNYTTTHEAELEAQATVYCLERGHILKKSFNELDPYSILKEYIGTLDNTHLFFLASEVQNYQDRFGPMLDIYFVRGNLQPAFEIYKDFYKRLEKRVEWINHRLDQPFDLNTPETFIVDRRKQAWPKDAAEADKFWENRLTLDLIIELLGEEKTPASTIRKSASGDDAATAVASGASKLPPEKITPERLTEAISKIRKRYGKILNYLRFEPYEVEEIYLNTLTTQYDPHTSFFSKQSREEFEIAMRNKLIGVGAVLQDDEGYCTIKDILPGGPIEGTKRIRIGDRIIAIGQGEKGDLVDIVGLRINKIVNQLRGQSGTTVRLRIEPIADYSARYTVTLKRSEIKLTTKLAQAVLFEVPVGDKTVPLGLVTLPAFYGKGSDDGDAFSTTDDVAELIGKLKKHGVQGIVLDLRRNGGGLLSEAVNLTGLFIPGGPVVQTRSVEGRSEQSDVPLRDSVLWDGPLIVLVSKLSASASEIVAGALKDHQRAIIVGDENTHGKGTVQQVVDYSRFDKRLGSALKFTIQKWYLPSGNSIQLKGVASDIIVPSIYSVLPVAESDLEHPLAWDSISSALAPAGTSGNSPVKAPVSSELLAALRADSARRQAEMPEFITLGRTIAWTKSREKTRAFPVNYETLRAERVEDKSFRDSIRTAHKKLEATNFKAEIIKLDSAIEQEKQEAALKAETEKQAAATAKKGADASKAAPKAADKDNDNDDEDDEDAEDSADTLHGAHPAKQGIDVQKRESLRILGDWLTRLDGSARKDTKVLHATGAAH